MTPKDILKAAKTVLVIDWPSKEVPELLALAGLQVVVKGGPGPEDYFVYEVKDGKVESRRAERPPQKAELVYSYRPLGELPAVLASAKELQAQTIWTQSGLGEDGKRDVRGCRLSAEDRRRAGDLIRAAGLHHIWEPYIGDVARQLL